MMTKVQCKKLDTLIAKVEALQHEVSSRDADLLAKAKAELFRALRAQPADRQP